MKISTLLVLSLILLTNSAQAFSLPTSDSLNTNESQLKTCILQEAKNALTAGILTKDNINSQAAKIAAACATKATVKNDTSTLQLATTIINGLLK